MSESDNGKIDQMALVDFISDHIYSEYGNSISPEVVRQVMAHVTEAVIEKINDQEKLPFDVAAFKNCPKGAQ